MLALIVSVQPASCLQRLQTQRRNTPSPRRSLGPERQGAASFLQTRVGSTDVWPSSCIPKLGFGSPCNGGIYCPAETHPLQEGRGCSLSPGHRYMGMLTPSGLLAESGFCFYKAVDHPHTHGADLTPLPCWLHGHSPHPGYPGAPNQPTLTI